MEIDLSGLLSPPPANTPTTVTDNVFDSCSKAARAAAASVGVSATSLLSNTRKAAWCLGRQAAMHVVYEHTEASYQAIGEWFGVDHGTVMHAHRRIRDRKALEKGVAKLVEAVEAALSMTIKDIR